MDEAIRKTLRHLTTIDPAEYLSPGEMLELIEHVTAARNRHFLRIGATMTGLKQAHLRTHIALRQSVTNPQNTVMLCGALLYNPTLSYDGPVNCIPCLEEYERRDQQETSRDTGET